MNEQLQVALTEILNKTMKGVEAGVGFLQAELPDVIQQLLIWKAAEACITAVFGALVLVALVLMLKSALKKEKIDENGGFMHNVKPTLIYDSDGDIHPGSIFVGTAAVLGFPISGAMVAELKTVVQIWLAPKIYLIEYAASLAK